jgi:hypothetical protein
MENRILQFISALRAGGVRISLAESADAFKAVEELGIKNRDGFRLSLRSTLVKEAKDIPLFEEMFPLFFDSSEPPPLMDVTKDLTQEESQMLAEALRQLKEDIRQLMERLLHGEQLSQQELDRLGQLMGINRADNLRYREWMVQRLEKAMHFPEVREAMRELAALLEEMGMNKQKIEQLQKLMQANQNALKEQLQQYVGQNIADNMSKSRPDQNLDGILHQPFNSLSDRDMDKLRKEVQRMASVLRTRLALRQKRAKSGQLDAKATIRANLKHGNVPIDIKHRDHSLKPKVVVICDVSTSMRHCSELMLNLLYAIQDQISKTHAFAFIDHLEYISPEFEGKEAREAVEKVLKRMPSGYYNTDLGRCLVKFTRDHMETVDHHTTFIMVGDGRNNYNSPREDLFTRIARRTRRMIWLNPEAQALWGTGDSDMLQYAPACDAIFQVNNLAQLAAAVDQLLS